MRTRFIPTLILAFAAAGASLQVFADDHDNHHFVHHDEWKKGAHIQADDWKRGEHVDYRTQHLRAPPRGYEWRMVDGNYVLAAVATGIIASVVTASIVAH